MSRDKIVREVSKQGRNSPQNFHGLPCLHLATHTHTHHNPLHTTPAIFTSNYCIRLHRAGRHLITHWNLSLVVTCTHTCTDKQSHYKHFTTDTTCAQCYIHLHSAFGVHVVGRDWKRWIFCCVISTLLGYFFTIPSLHALSLFHLKQMEDSCLICESSPSLVDWGKLGSHRYVIVEQRRYRQKIQLFWAASDCCNQWIVTHFALFGAQLHGVTVLATFAKTVVN